MRNAWLLGFAVFTLPGCEVFLGLEDTKAHAGDSPEPKVPFVALGQSHGCAVVNARLYCWGDNTFGQLGVGGTEPSDVPRALPVAGSWSAVAAGTFHSCALDELGRVACWGLNDRGQLGTGDREPRDEPTFVNLPERVSFISSDFSHTCALSDSTLFCWGKNDEGELGQDDELFGDELSADALEPVSVPGSFRTVETGQGHTCAIGDDGELFCWGRNSEHELGELELEQVRLPTRVGSEDDWLAVEAGQDHTCGLREDFSAYCWGYNTALDMGEGAPLGIAGVTLVTAPSRLETAAEFTRLSTHTFHACAIDRDRGLFCWGRNAEGQLGTGDEKLHETPVLVGHAYVGVEVGRFATCAIEEDGDVACAGANDSGQLGTGDTELHLRLTPIAFE